MFADQERQALPRLQCEMSSEAWRSQPKVFPSASGGRRGPEAWVTCSKNKQGKQRVHGQ